MQKRKMPRDADSRAAQIVPMLTRKLILLCCLSAMLVGALPLRAEVIIYKFTGKRRVIFNGSEVIGVHSGSFVVDFDTGQGYLVDTYKQDGTRYVRVVAINGLEYFRARGGRNYTIIRVGLVVGIGAETALDLGPIIAGPMPRTFTTTIAAAAGDDPDNAQYYHQINTFSFNKSLTQRANLNLYSALVTTIAIHQDYLSRGYTDLTWAAAATPVQTSGAPTP